MSGPTYNNRTARFAGGSRTASKKMYHWKRAAAARQVMPGFPIETPFNIPQDVWDYLNGDTITCLRCGKPYKALVGHLRVHGWTEEQYKEFYGLPWKTGLTCSSTKSLLRENGLKNVEAGVAFGGLMGDAETLKKAHAAKRRKRAPYLKGVCVLNGAKDPVRVEAGEFLIWVTDDYWRIPERMKTQDRTMSEVCNDEDLPGVAATYVYARKHADFAKSLDCAWEELSFSVQARGQRLGKRFFREAARLRAQGLIAKQIGERLGVHWVTVENHISGVAIPEKTHCPQGHPYLDGARRCKICNTEHARAVRGYLPRAESAKVKISVLCSECGASIERSRLSGRRRRAICNNCRKEYFRQYDINRGRTRSLAP